jgi:hypothetical protein
MLPEVRAQDCRGKTLALQGKTGEATHLPQTRI